MSRPSPKEILAGAFARSHARPRGAFRLPDILDAADAEAAVTVLREGGHLAKPIHPAVGTGAHLAPIAAAGSDGLPFVPVERLRELLAGAADDEDRAILSELIALRDGEAGVVLRFDPGDPGGDSTRVWVLGAPVESRDFAFGLITDLGNKVLWGTDGFAAWTDAHGDEDTALDEALTRFRVEEGGFDRHDLAEALDGKVAERDEVDLAAEDGIAVYGVETAPVAVRVRRFLGLDDEGGEVSDREARVEVAGRSTEEVAALVVAAAREASA